MGKLQNVVDWCKAHHSTAAYVAGIVTANAVYGLVWLLFHK